MTAGCRKTPQTTTGHYF